MCPSKKKSTAVSEKHPLRSLRGLAEISCLLHMKFMVLKLLKSPVKLSETEAALTVVAFSNTWSKKRIFYRRNIWFLAKRNFLSPDFEFSRNSVVSISEANSNFFSDFFSSKENLTKKKLFLLRSFHFSKWAELSLAALQKWGSLFIVKAKSQIF